MQPNLRNKLVYLCAHATSFGSSWALYIYLHWKIYILYSIQNLGLYALVSGLPALLLMNFGGVLADKYNKKNSLIFMQIISIVMDFALIFLLTTNNLTLESMLIYGIGIGVLGAFSRPFNQSILCEIIDKEDTAQILGFNSILYNVCRIFVPLLVGMMLINHEYIIIQASIALSIASLVFYSLLICKKSKQDNEASSFSELFYEQKAILLEYPELLQMFLVAVIVSMTLGSYTFLIPALNEFLHNGDPIMLSYLYGVSGVGALSVGLLKIYNKPKIKMNLIPLLGILASMAMAALMQRNEFFLEFFAFYMLAFFTLLIFISCSQAVYETASEEQHGRLLSILGMGIIGIAPFSNAMTGFFVSWWGLEFVCLIYAATCGLFCLGFLFKMNKTQMFFERS